MNIFVIFFPHPPIEFTAFLKYDSIIIVYPFLSFL